jgi:predicted metalloprotease
MRYDENYTSSDVEDRRGEGPVSGGGGGGGAGLMYLLFRIFGWPGLIVGALVAGGAYLYSSHSSQPTSHGPVQAGPEENKLVHFVGFVFDDVQRTWRAKLPSYKNTTLVLFRHSTRSGCGVASSAVGPFYCPADEKVYIDLAFYDELRKRFGAPGDFAQAYVIAHEVGHHVQNLRGLGVGRGSSVPIELQADCLAGAWAQDAERRGELEVGDVDEALNAATQIGDDTLARKAGREVQPDSFTHGSSAQRVANFKKGYQGGPQACGI